MGLPSSPPPAALVTRRKLGLLKRVLGQKQLLPPAAQVKFYAGARPTGQVKGYGTDEHALRWGPSMVSESPV